MAQDTQNIGDLIRKLGENNDEVYSLVCRVVEVSGEVAELAPLNGDANIFGVKLIAGTSATNLLITPTKGSVVIATFLSKDTAFIGLYSDIDSVAIRGDQYGGLIKIEELVKDLQKFNVFLEAFTSVLGGIPVFEPGNGSPSALQAALNLALASLSLPTYTTIENDNIKHG
jgi:hypothetical protein